MPVQLKEEKSLIATTKEMQRVKIKELLEQGLSQTEIANQLGLTRSAINHAIRRAEAKGQGIDKVKNRPVTPIVLLITKILRDNHWTTDDLANALKKPCSTVKGWVRGENKPRSEMVAKLEELARQTT